MKELYKKIEKVCIAYNIQDYIITENGSINVHGDVDFSNNFFIVNSNGEAIQREKLKRLPLRFNFVFGNFNCSNNDLITLERSPIEVTGNFSCENNCLTNLVGSPIVVGGFFDCFSNMLVSLRGAPKRIGEYFQCYGNNLPREIFDNYKFIKNIVNMQNDYDIWNPDGSIEQFRFKDMMLEVKELEGI